MNNEDFDLDALLAEADDLIANREPELVDVKLGKRMVGVRYMPMSGTDWRTLTLKHPPRPDIRQDLNLGYNVDAVAAAYTDVVLIDGDKVVSLIRTDAKGNDYSVWPKVYARLTKTGLDDVTASMWAAHERAPERLVVDAGKASPGSRKKKPS
jgi:hypothetical protein